MKAVKPKKEWIKVFLSQAPEALREEIAINLSNPSSRRRKGKPFVKDYAVSLVTAGFTRKDVAKEFGISDRLLGSWLADHRSRAYQIDLFKGQDLTIIGDIPVIKLPQPQAKPSLWSRVKSWFK